ncbi:MAG: Sua5/YciO/YrdC/YwlC family protein [Rhizobacter sp.]|nr:Sua5/YciO/YrdC/YwlC family protein [Rhizobacter sp.]
MSDVPMPGAVAMPMPMPPHRSLVTPTDSEIAEAARALARGELVAFPTETVYGLGARADDDLAVARIFAAKGRPSDHPLIVHVVDLAGAEAFADRLPPVARRLMAAFWPGPLTVIVPRRPGMGAASAGGQDSIGLRCPSHPVAQALLAAALALGVKGVAAPSANRFGRVSPTLASHVAAEFIELKPPLLVLDGGPCEVGIESTIVDCTRDAPVLLRPGVIGREAIEHAAGEYLKARDAASPRASGTLEAHYAPNAKVRVMDTAQLSAALRLRAADAAAAADPAGNAALDTAGNAASPAQPKSAATLAVYSRTRRPGSGSGDGAGGDGEADLHEDVTQGVLYRRMPNEPAAAARELFATLRELDALGVALIWIEALPTAPVWDGVRDRIQRAAAA